MTGLAKIWYGKQAYRDGKGKEPVCCVCGAVALMLVGKRGFCKLHREDGVKAGRVQAGALGVDVFAGRDEDEAWG